MAAEPEDGRPLTEQLMSASRRIKLLEERITAQFSMFALLGTVFARRTPEFLDEFRAVLVIYRDDQLERGKQERPDAHLNLIRAEEASQMLNVIHRGKRDGFTVIAGGKEAPSQDTVD